MIKPKEEKTSITTILMCFVVVVFVVVAFIVGVIDILKTIFNF